MKVVLIGPVYPYKGGISHYTGLMCRALREKHQVVMISYKMQYPRFLFKREQRDYSNDRFQIKDTGYMIHTADPLNWVISALKIRKEKADAIIIQWWHPYFAPCYYMMSKFWGKTRMVFICHNVFPHERFPMDRFLSKLALRRGNRFIVQSHQDEQDLLSLKKQAVYRVAPHPTYQAFRLEGLSQSEGRRRIGIESGIPVILFFGFVREYKGLKHLLDALPYLKEKLPDLRLWVVGDFDGDKQNYLDRIEKLKADDQVCLVDGYIPDNEVEKYFAAADLVVLPYESATQSGIVQIAYGFEKPVVVTRVGGLPDVVKDGETGYVVEPGNPLLIARAIIRYFEENRREDFRKNIKDMAEEFSWGRMAEYITELIRR